MSWHWFRQCLYGWQVNSTGQTWWDYQGTLPLWWAFLVVIFLQFIVPPKLAKAIRDGKPCILLVCRVHNPHTKESLRYFEECFTSTGYIVFGPPTHWTQLLTPLNQIFVQLFSSNAVFLVNLEMSIAAVLCALYQCIWQCRLRQPREWLRSTSILILF